MNLYPSTTFRRYTQRDARELASSVDSTDLGRIRDSAGRAEQRLESAAWSVSCVTPYYRVLMASAHKEKQLTI